MTDNDYIAEYVKEKYPHILGAGFVLWKFGRMLVDIGATIKTVIMATPPEEIKRIIESGGENAEI